MPEKMQTEKCDVGDCQAILNLQQAMPICLGIVRDLKLNSDADLLVPFRFANCMLFLSGSLTQVEVDVAVSEPVYLDLAIKSAHLNSRFVMNQMIQTAVELYGSDGQQEYAMSFLFRDGCGLVKSEQNRACAVNLIERLPIELDYHIRFATEKG